MNRIKANAPIRVNKDVDTFLKNLKVNFFGQPHDEVLITTDPRYIHYEANEDRIILEDGPLFGNPFGGTGSVKCYQNLISKQIVNGVLQRFLVEFGQHPRNTTTIIAYRENY